MLRELETRGRVAGISKKKIPKQKIFFIAFSDDMQQLDRHSVGSSLNNVHPGEEEKKSPRKYNPTYTTRKTIRKKRDNKTKPPKKMFPTIEIAEEK